MAFRKDFQLLPTKQEEVTAAWLANFLGENIESIVITSAIMQQTAAKVFVTVVYGDNTDESRPTQLCLKGSFNPDIMAMKGYREPLLALYTREVDFYNHVAPKLTSTRLPKVFRAAASVEPPQGLLAMEDLNQHGYTFGRPAESWSLDRVKEGIEQLAALHAGTWNNSLKDLPGFTPAYEQVMLGLTAMWNQVVLGADRPTIPNELKSQKRIVAALKKHFATKNPKFLCLVHGDPHSGNTFFDQRGKPSFLDWQTAHIGSAFHDVAYFVVGSMPVEDRRALEISILDHYLQTLAKYGGPNLSSGDPEVLTEYKKSMMAGFGWILTPYAVHSVEHVKTMVERYCAALVDHNVIELVEWLPVTSYGSLRGCVVS